MYILHFISLSFSNKAARMSVSIEPGITELHRRILSQSGEWLQVSHQDTGSLFAAAVVAGSGDDKGPPCLCTVW